MDALNKENVDPSEPSLPQPQVERRRDSIYDNYNVLDHITGNGVFAGTTYEERSKNILHSSYTAAHDNFQLENFKRQYTKLKICRDNLYVLANEIEDVVRVEESMKNTVRPEPVRVTTQDIEHKICMNAIVHYETQWKNFEDNMEACLGNDNTPPSVTFNMIPWPFFRATTFLVRGSTLGFQPKNIPLDPVVAKKEIEDFIYHPIRFMKYVSKEGILEAEKERWCIMQTYPNLIRRSLRQDVGLISSLFIYVAVLLRTSDEFELKGYSNTVSQYIEAWYEEQRKREAWELEQL